MVSKVDQFKEEIVNGKSALVYFAQHSSRCCELKNHCGGINYTKCKPRIIPINQITILSGKLNVYQLVQSYFAVPRSCNLRPDRIFLGNNQGRQKQEVQN